MPSEHELSRKYGVSRATVREALRELIASGLVDRRHGKGSFVRAPVVAGVAPLKFTGFLEDLYEQVEKVAVRGVEIEERTGPEPVLQKLGMPAGSRVTIVRRVRDVEGSPFAWTVNFIPDRVGRRLRQADLLKYPLLRILEERFKIQIGEAVQTFRADRYEFTVRLRRLRRGGQWRWGYRS